jgi:ABC-type branched-subunit amino acid transport system substrate-binding protein/predicted negative regulator of RcsB-dependent stress response
LREGRAGLCIGSDSRVTTCPAHRARPASTIIFLIALLFAVPTEGQAPPPLLGPLSDTVPVLRPGGPASDVTGSEKGTVPLLRLWRAETEFQYGHADKALSQFLTLGYDFSDDERKGFVWMRVAELQLARREPKKALDAAEKAILLTRARFLALSSMDLKFRIYRQLGWGAEARQVAAFLLTQGYINAEPSALLAEMARADGRDGRISLALSEYRQAIAASEADPVSALRFRRERDALIDGLTNIAALREAAESSEDSAVRNLLYLRLGQVAIRKGFIGMGVFALEKASRGGGMRGEEASRQLYRLERIIEYRPKIVGLLPLSGKYAGLGFAVLSGAEVALRRSHGLETELMTPVLRWTDTGGEPERARAGFAAASSDPSVIGFIGPLTGEEGYSVSIEFDQDSPPVLYLGQKIIPEKPFLYSFGLTPQQEASAVLSHLARSGRDDLMLFYPENGYGRGFRDAVAYAAGEAGVRVGIKVSYNPENSDFTDAIRRAVGRKAFVDASRKKDKGAAMKLPQEAIVIADRWERVFLLASQLRFYNVYLPLAGFSGWNDVELLRKAGEAVNQSVFSVDYAGTVPGFQGEKFRKECRETLERIPTRFEALGYDAALLLEESYRLTTDGNARPAGEQTRERIPLLRMFRGVTGMFHFGPAGEMRREVTLLQVELDDFIPVPEP